MEYIRRKKYVSRQQAEDIVEMTRRGYSMIDITYYTGVKRYSLLRFLDDNGITVRNYERHRWTDDEKEALAKMYNEGRTVDDMVGTFVHSRASILVMATRLRKAGLITRWIGHKQRPRKNKMTNNEQKE